MHPIPGQSARHHLEERHREARRWQLRHLARAERRAAAEARRAAEAERRADEARAEAYAAARRAQEARAAAAYASRESDLVIAR